MAEDTTQPTAEPTPPPAEPATAPPAAVEAPKVEEIRTAPPLPAGTQFIRATGRRKKAVAQIRLRPGSGNFMVNKRKVEDYFHVPQDLNAAYQPLHVLKMAKSWDIWVNVSGGGSTGQAGAVMLGLARALMKVMKDEESALRDVGLLTRDARMKERKKYGQKGARKRFQYSKR